MKNARHIEKLLEKYYRGESSTGEEKALNDFFRAGDIPEHLRAEAELFGFFDREKEDALSGEMEVRLDALISGSEQNKFSTGRGLRYFWISGAAAVILILIGIFVDLQLNKNTGFEVHLDTFQDPYLAYNEAKKVLYIVSDKLNTGRESMKNLEKLESGVNYMHPIFSFGTSIQHLEHFSAIEETRKLISK